MVPSASDAWPQRVRGGDRPKHCEKPGEDDVRQRDGVCEGRGERRGAEMEEDGVERMVELRASIAPGDKKKSWGVIA